MCECVHGAVITMTRRKQLLKMSEWMFICKNYLIPYFEEYLHKLCIHPLWSNEFASGIALGLPPIKKKKKIEKIKHQRGRNSISRQLLSPERVVSSLWLQSWLSCAHMSLAIHILSKISAISCLLCLTVHWEWDSLDNWGLMLLLN